MCGTEAKIKKKKKIDWYQVGYISSKPIFKLCYLIHNYNTIFGILNVDFYLRLLLFISEFQRVLSVFRTPFKQPVALTLGKLKVKMSNYWNNMFFFCFYFGYILVFCVCFCYRSFHLLKIPCLYLARPPISKKGFSTVLVSIYDSFRFFYK